MRPFIGAYTPLYSVGQYRETMSPYLGRTLQLVGYEGELQFGLHEEPQRRMTPGAVCGALERCGTRAWHSSIRESGTAGGGAGFPDACIAADNYTVAVSRL